MLEVLGKKLDYIESVGFDSSLICITESHLDDKVLDDDIKLDGYYYHSINFHQF